ncbi:unnamed protein product [Ilex paraguariensis]|uniref:Uncharacterized protein n=1 Tax=Ilex paraguariensis TaxID=185542 RepID=A0ABC8UR83_9AQUA
MVMTSWPFKDDNNISFSDIYDAIEYGFELSWFKTQCENCELGYCFHRGDNQKLCTSYCSFLGMIVPFSPELLMLSTKCGRFQHDLTWNMGSETYASTTSQVQLS